MIAATAPIGEILERLVLLIEAQSPEMLCSVLLLNLVMNGMEAMNGIEQGTLELTVKIDRVESGGVVVAVTDRGTGIKPNELDRVFKAFHTTKNASLGMGLAFCRSIIEAHGGRLWAESNIGPGTTFKFTLPAGV